MTAPRPEPEPQEPLGAGPPEQDADLNESVDDYVEDVLAPAGGSTVAGSVRARTAFLGSTRIGTVVIGGQGAAMLPVYDMTTAFEGEPFVEPAGFPALVDAIAGSSLAICRGALGCGKDSAATRALLRAGRRTVFALPRSDPARTLEALRHLSHTSPGAGCILQGADEHLLRALDHGSPASLQRTIESLDLKVVALVHEGTSDRRLLGHHFVDLSAPDAAGLVIAYTSRSHLSASQVRDLTTAAQALPAAPGPGIVSAMVSTIEKGDATSADDLLSMFSGENANRAIRDWSSDTPTVREVAALVAGVTLDGGRAADVSGQAQLLAALLSDDLPDRASGIWADAAWPAEILQLDLAVRSTHFGRQPVEVVRVAAPHDSADLIRALWGQMSDSARQASCDWIRGLAHDRRHRWSAAFTAGVLFVADPAQVEESILRPWANGSTSGERRCAGVALGSALSLGTDPEPSRALARSWARNGSPRTVEAAVVAYGGPLGVWDDATSGAYELMQVLAEHPELERQVHAGLASLVVAGGEASTSRARTLAYLVHSTATRTGARLAFRCLPAVTAALLSRHPTCVESLEALRVDPPAFANYCALVASSLVTAGSVDTGRSSVLAAVDAVSRGHPPPSLLVDMVRQMKVNAEQSGTLPRLGRVLQLELRRIERTPPAHRAATARDLRQHFFDG